MPSTFFGLEIGRRALSANQLALQVTGNNTANVNTPGYSRQVVRFAQTDPYPDPTLMHPVPGQLGTGVRVAAVTRVRDEFIDRRIYHANAIYASLQGLRDVVTRVEEAFNEPGNASIGQLMTDFFNAFADLSANPESGAIRSTVRNRAQTLISAFHSVSATLGTIGPDVQSRLESQIRDVNDIARELAALNRQIRASIAVGDSPNDLMDARGALLDRLSQLVDVQIVSIKDPTTGLQTGDLRVSVGGFLLVEGDYAGTLPSAVAMQSGVHGLKTTVGDFIPLYGGSLHGLIKAKTLVDGYASDLDLLAANLISAVNAQHQIGYGLDGLTARDFFVGTGAADIGLSAAVLNSLDAIAAAAPPVFPNPFAPGNGDNARAIAALSHVAVIGTFSLNEYYNDRIATIGSDLRTYRLQAANQQKVLNQLQTLQASVSGVSLDEELTQMLQYQRAYQAAARMIDVMDETLDRIINGLGGRR
ncbi:MAG: flagellar hook-associated protein FlgK [Chloroherpetonaceae bacterium]|nr:flagellar hook-associated protein FlgK [Chthonomonadaceae bacterium]MDW8207711.1 flagellar hook-associated protein FlgK [Chloroherpetonaceae bacterium]